MRKYLLDGFDTIYILDLHGNSRRQEKCPDGSIDKNVFDIMAGVSINIFIKTGNKKKKENVKVNHFDLYGKREYKYEYLEKNNLNSIKWNKLNPTSPNYFLVNRDFSEKLNYDKGFSLKDMFNNTNSGLATEFDGLAIQFNKGEAQKVLKDLQELESSTIRNNYNFKEKELKKIDKAKKDIAINEAKILPINYRPFDTKYCIYTGKSNGVMGRPRNSTMQHFIKGDNLGIIVSRTVYGNYKWNDIQITNKITEKGIMAMRVGNAAIVCPLFAYPKTGERVSNLNPQIINKISDKLNLTFSIEKDKSGYSSYDVLDYIFAILHSPKYKKKYQELLKVDFPKIPYPKNEKTFWDLVKLGTEVREIHLLESNKVENYITNYEMAENAENDHNVITTKIGKKDWEIINQEKQLGRIWINESKYFDNVPVTAWEFYIGGYQPAQKWLKDRKERELKFEDILHYQKIIVALTETDRIMKEIDKIEIE